MRFGLPEKTIEKMCDLFALHPEIDDLLLPWMIDLSIYSQIENKDLIDHINRIGQFFYQRNPNKPQSAE